jgi:hypothetical protein
MVIVNLNERLKMKINVKYIESVSVPRYVWTKANTTRYAETFGGFVEVK